MPNPGDPRIEQPRNPLELHITIRVPFQYPMYTDRDGWDVYLDEMTQSPGNLNASGNPTVTLANPIGSLRGNTATAADTRTTIAPKAPIIAQLDLGREGTQAQASCSSHIPAAGPLAVAVPLVDNGSAAPDWAQDPRP